MSNSDNWDSTDDETTDDYIAKYLNEEQDTSVTDDYINNYLNQSVPSQTDNSFPDTDYYSQVPQTEPDYSQNAYTQVDYTQQDDTQQGYIQQDYTQANHTQQDDAQSDYTQQDYISQNYTPGGYGGEVTDDYINNYLSGASQTVEPQTTIDDDYINQYLNQNSQPSPPAVPQPPAAPAKSVGSIGGNSFAKKRQREDVIPKITDEFLANYVRSVEPKQDMNEFQGLTFQSKSPPAADVYARPVSSDRDIFDNAGNDDSDWRTWLGASYVQKRGMDIMKAVTNDLRVGKRMNMPMVLRLIDDFVTSCKRNEDHFITLARVKDTDNYSFAHPVNVAIYSIAMGAVMNYNSKQLARLGLAALMHDIGEIKLPARMLNKASKFTGAELATMQKHPAFGYEVLKKDPAIPEDVLLGVLHHHERLDGSGYPSGHLGRFIHPLGKIIALAETFDAMTSDRHNATGIVPTEALKTLYGLAGKHYEPNAVKALIMLLGMFPMGSLVRLSGGHLAVVFTKNKEDLSKPNVIVITDVSGQPVEPYIVNLYSDVSKRRILFPENANILQIDTNKYIQDFLLRNKG